MNLSVCSTTLREIAGEASRFPDELRALICDAVSAVSLTKPRICTIISPLRDMALHPRLHPRLHLRLHLL